MPVSGFLTKIAENNCEENHFSVEFFSEFSQKLFSCSVSKNNSFTGLLQFLTSLNMSDVSITQSNIKMGLFAKIVNSCRDVIRTELKI